MLALTGIGMVSVLGLDSVTSCAAARAGIRRIVETDDLFVNDIEGDETAPVAIHRVPVVAKGFFGFARLEQLGWYGLQDLLLKGGVDLQGRLGMILLVSDGMYEEAWFRRTREEDEEPSEESDEDQGARASRARVAEELLNRLVARAGLPVAPELRATLSTTAVGLSAALQTVEEWFKHGMCDCCIVGGVDSLVQPVTLAALDGKGLLRTIERPACMIPGEAAGFVALEKPKSAARKARVQAIVEAPASAREAPHPALEAQGPDDGGLRAAIAHTLAQLPDAGRATGLVVVNLNGDDYRASSWWRGIASSSEQVRLDALPAWYPPLFFGEIGAATGPVALAMLASGWARGYAPGTNALICLLDDRGGRGTVYVRSPVEVRT
jgi:3-oxoacyl-[acyl-carrier-protein] synthase I